MCDPVTMTAVTIGMSVVSAGVQYMGQQAQAQQTAAYDAAQKANIEQNRINLIAQAQNQEDLINRQDAQKVDENAQQMRAALATASVAAGEAGVSGNSVDAVAREFYSRGDQYADTVELNRKADVDRLQLQMKGFNIQASNQVNALPVAQPPSFLDAALRVGGAAGGAYGKYLYTPPTPTAAPGV